MPSLAQRYFAAGALLGLLALARLVLLLGGAGQGPSRSEPIRLDTEIRVSIAGAQGDTARIFIPEVPLSLEAPLRDQQVRIPVSLALNRRPRTVVVQVVRQGRVVATSQSLPLAEGQVVDLGQVEVHPP